MATRTKSPAAARPSEHPVADDRHHLEAALRMGRVGQRYTDGRRALVDVLAGAGRPLTIPEVLERVDGVPQSSAYRNLTALIDAGVVQRMSGSGDFDRFELAEQISGHHHHHLICTSCGLVDDIAVTPQLERALADAAAVATDATGFVIDDHRIDLVGRCATCAS